MCGGVKGLSRRESEGKLCGGRSKEKASSEWCEALPRGRGQVLMGDSFSWRRELLTWG